MTKPLKPSNLFSTIPTFWRGGGLKQKKQREKNKPLLLLITKDHPNFFCCKLTMLVRLVVVAGQLLAPIWAYI